MNQKPGRFSRATRLYLFYLKLRPFMVRYIFLIICIGGLLWHAVYMNYIIERLKKNADYSTRTYAKLISAALFDKMGQESEKVVLGEIVEDFDIPIIITTPSLKPIIWKNIFHRPFLIKREIDSDDESFETMKLLEKKVVEFKRKYSPKTIYGRDNVTIKGYLVYGNSSLLSGLAWLPFFEAVFIVLFSAFVYFALHNVMITERSNLWVGLAKETAHQLGTPISSLMGWVEYMKAVGEPVEGQPPPAAEEYGRQVREICENMDHDLTRLRKITNRFSQVGSAPALVPTDINSVIEDTRNYLMLRLPVLRKRIEIRTVPGDVPQVDINRDLMEWVFENLMKNSINAIRRDDGLITITTEYIAVEGIVRVTHVDNGSGVPRKLRSRIFAPGFTTKKRGWGLGLTLAKRIVEDYHRGRIYLNRSVPDKETSFCVDLPASRSPVAASEGKPHGGGTQERPVG